MFYDSTKASRISRKIGIERVGSRVVYENMDSSDENSVEVLKLCPYPQKSISMEIIEMEKDAFTRQIESPSSGIPELREEICRAIFEEIGVCIDPDNVIITNGGMHALTIIFNTILDPGDEVLIFAPCYFFGGVIELAGGIPVYVHLDENTGFRYDCKKLEDRISGRTKAIVINNPANPTGYVVTREEIEEIARIAEKYDLYIVSDESYNTMIFDGLKNISILEKQDIKERVIVARSFTKTYAMPGWRLGYIIADENLKKHLQKILEWGILHCNYFSQRVALHVIRSARSWVNEVKFEFQNNRDIIYNSYGELSIFNAVKPKGTPFIFFNISKIDLKCEEISKILVEKFGIPSVPGTYHKSGKHIRICFGGEAQTVVNLTERLKAAEDYFIKKGRIKD